MDQFTVWMELSIACAAIWIPALLIVLRTDAQKRVMKAVILIFGVLSIFFLAIGVFQIGLIKDISQIPSAVNRKESQSQNVETAEKSRWNVEKAEQYYIEANRYHNNGDFEIAIKLYTEAIKIVPDSGKYYKQRGVSYREINEFEKSLEDYNQAFQLGVHLDASFYFNRSVSYYGLGRLEEALNDITMAFQAENFEEIEEDCYHERAVIYDSLKEYDLSLSDYQKAIELDVDNDSIYYSRSITYGNMGNYENALIDINRALDIKPEKQKYLEYKNSVEQKLR